jgi:hypothetical protein
MAEDWIRSGVAERLPLLAGLAGPVGLAVGLGGALMMRGQRRGLEAQDAEQAEQERAGIIGGIGPDASREDVYRGIQALDARGQSSSYLQSLLGESGTFEEQGDELEARRRQEVQTTVDRSLLAVNGANLMDWSPQDVSYAMATYIQSGTEPPQQLQQLYTDQLQQRASRNAALDAAAVQRDRYVFETGDARAYDEQAAAAGREREAAAHPWRAYGMPDPVAGNTYVEGFDGQLYQRPIPGTEAALLRSRALDSTRNSEETTTALLEAMDTFGTGELTGGGAQIMQTLFSELVVKVAQMSEAGALGDEERRVYEEILGGSPASWYASLLRGDDAARAGILRLQTRLRQSYAQQLEREGIASIEDTMARQDWQPQDVRDPGTRQERPPAGTVLVQEPD